MAQLALQNLVAELTAFQTQAGNPRAGPSMQFCWSIQSTGLEIKGGNRKRKPMLLD